VERLRSRASVLGSRCRRLAVAGVVLGLGAVSGVAAGSSGERPPASRTGTSPISVTLPLRAVIVSRSTAGSVLTLAIGCKNGSAGDVCSGPIRLTATGGKKVATASYSMPTGSQTTVKVALDRIGKRLLAKSYKLAATLSLAGTTTVTRTVHFHYPVVEAPVEFTWLFSSASTRAEVLSVSGIPAGGVVKVICDGGGCPFSSKSFSVGSAGKVNLEPSFKSRRLRPNTRLTLEITDTNYVGKITKFLIKSGSQPTELVECLPPGASRPSKCA
jgi:hypothetical protein